MNADLGSGIGFLRLGLITDLDESFVHEDDGTSIGVTKLVGTCVRGLGIGAENTKMFCSNKVVIY